MNIVQPSNSSHIINDVRRFVFQLRYNDATQGFYNHIQGKRNHSGRDLNLTLNSPHDPNYHKFRSLNGRVNQLQGAQYEEIKKVWNEFFEGVQKTDRMKIRDAYIGFTSIFPMDLKKLSDLGDTDLVIYPDDHPGPIPVNGIRQSEFNVAFKHYYQFINLLQFDFRKYPHLDQEKFANQIHRDIRRLMSIPLGRLLIERLLGGMTPQTKLIIEPSNTFQYTCLAVTPQDPSTHRIEYSLDTTFSYQKLDGGLSSLSTPPCISLAHELLHMVHLLEGTFFHHFNPNLNRILDTNEEETHVIRNESCCSRHPYPDPCNEETLREQLSLPVRDTHLAGCKPDESPEKAYLQALLVGSKSDADAAFRSGKIASPILNTTARMLSPGAVQRFRKIAQDNPECRKGPFKDVSAPSTSSSNQPSPAAQQNPVENLSDDSRRIFGWDR